MKQFYITFLMILSFGAAAIASGQAVTVTAPTQFVLVGSTPTLAITASDTTGLGILGYRGEITYNPNVIVVVGGNAGCNVSGTISSSFVAFCSDNFVNATTRRIDFFTSGAVPLTGAGDLIKFNFQVVGAAGTSSPLTFTDFFFNEGGPFDPIDVTVNGLITIVPASAAAASLSGRVVAQDGRPLPRIRVTLIDASGDVSQAISSVFGYYRFDDVQIGQSYLLQASSKSYLFVPKVVTLGDELNEIDIIALP